MPIKSPYEYVHWVRIELAKLILAGTMITYQATGNAGIRYIKHALRVVHVPRPYEIRKAYLVHTVHYGVYHTPGGNILGFGILSPGVIYRGGVIYTVPP